MGLTEQLTNAFKQKQSCVIEQGDYRIQVSYTPYSDSFYVRVYKRRKNKVFALIYENGNTAGFDEWWARVHTEIIGKGYQLKHKIYKIQ